MSLQSLDRTQWSYAEALAHVQTVTVARRAVEAAKLPPQPEPACQHWNPPQDPTIAWKAEAENELLVALRDGDLLAQGRYTEERSHSWSHGGSSSGFGLHSGYHTSIRPEHWREGKYLFGRLTARDWEFIDIRIPRFLVKAIWPDYVPEPVRATEGSDVIPYSPPYLELMHQAIRHFRLTDQRQEKKEVLSDWFRSHPIEGEPISKNLADAMATLIRLPSAQRGGAKRVMGPDLRQTG
jgi:hypothetical protein